MPNTPIALLIDADNLNAAEIRFAFDDAARRGEVTFAWACGTLDNLSARQAVLAQHGCRAEAALGGGKNSADILIAMEAAKLAWSTAETTRTTIAIVSRDRDFSQVGAKLAEAAAPTIAYAGPSKKTMRRSPFSITVQLPMRPEDVTLAIFRQFVDETLKRSAEDISRPTLQQQATARFGKGFVKRLNFDDFPKLLNAAGYVAETVKGGIRFGRVTKKPSLSKRAANITPPAPIKVPINILPEGRPSAARAKK